MKQYRSKKIICSLDDSFNKLQLQMRTNIRLQESTRPAVPHRQDRVHSRSLSKTEAPMGEILEHVRRSSGSHYDEKRSCGKSINEKSQMNNDSAELWKSKYEYTKKDNQLLQNQIAYLNEHINQLTRSKKDYQNTVKKALENIAKSFMSQIVKSQMKMLNSLEELEGKYCFIEQKIEKLLQEFNKLSSKADYRSIILKVNPMEIEPLKQGKNIYANINNDELFKVKLQNNKLLARVKTLQLQLTQTQNKYIENYQWNQQYLPPFEFNWPASTSGMARKR